MLTYDYKDAFAQVHDFTALKICIMPLICQTAALWDDQSVLLFHISL